MAVVAALMLGLVVASPVEAGGFTHGIAVTVDGDAYYLAGAPDGPGGAVDIPGHCLVQTSPSQLQGKHFNIGPFGAERWWSSDAPDGALLYTVHGIIDTVESREGEPVRTTGLRPLSRARARVDGALHSSKVVWLRHVAVTRFLLDGGPHPEFAHTVGPGIDFDFIPNGMVPYAS